MWLVPRLQQRMATAQKKFSKKIDVHSDFKQDLLFSTFKAKESQALQMHTPWTCWFADQNLVENYHCAIHTAGAWACLNLSILTKITTVELTLTGA